uniref:Uncharacterized protein n=1 Tax=Amphimedon queenslandica TaxID=400682 RepID=A0A1X7TAA5_AMPQE
MPKVREDCSKNMQFFPEKGKVVVLASSEEEREQCITQFQNTYQEIIKNRQLKSGSLEIPPAFQMGNMFDLLEECDAKYSLCHFSCDEKARVVRIVSMSSRQFDQAKKLLGGRLAGEKGDKWEEKTGKKKEEKGGATGGSSAGDGRTFTGLSKDVLLLMPKVREDCVKNMKFFPEEGKVVVLASSEEEREQCITQFLNSYKEIIKNRQLKSGSLEIPTAFQMKNIFNLLEEFDAKYSQCHFSCDEKARVVRIVSMSSRQFDQAKKLLGDRLIGLAEKKWEEKTVMIKKEKRGGSKALEATGTGSPKVLSVNKGHTEITRSSLQVDNFSTPPGSLAPPPYDGKERFSLSKNTDCKGITII